MDSYKIELMRSLQREYYFELKRKRKIREVFIYRLVISLLLGIITGFILL